MGDAAAVVAGCTIIGILAAFVIAVISAVREKYRQDRRWLERNETRRGSEKAKPIRRASNN
jgi:hypothetical protein